MRHQAQRIVWLALLVQQSWFGGGVTLWRAGNSLWRHVGWGWIAPGWAAPNVAWSSGLPAESWSSAKADGLERWANGLRRRCAGEDCENATEPPRAHNRAGWRGLARRRKTGSDWSALQGEVIFKISNSKSCQTQVTYYEFSKVVTFRWYLSSQSQWKKVVARKKSSDKVACIKFFPLE